jgi:excisionase family DNA binding protein
MAEVLTTSEAVRTFRMHPATVLRLILTGRLQAHKNSDGRWLINKDSLERWNRQRVRRTPKPEHGAIAATT